MLEKVELQWAVAFALGIENVLLLVWLFARAIARKRTLKRRRRELEERKKLFTLPQKDNTYLRMRLATALSPVAVADGGGEDLERPDFMHAQKLLKKLDGVSLTAAERLKTQRLALQFAVFGEQDKWNVQDVIRANEALLSLLKICGRYAV